MFEDQSFSIKVDQIECHLFGVFRLSETVEETRKASWEALLTKNPAAFDGSLLRMADHRIDDGRLIVAANSTSFSAYVATRHPGFGREYPHAERADPLGMTAVVLTADDCVIVTKRSLMADQNPGGLYLIGGYAEPCKGSDTVDLFQEVAREIAEEIAVFDLTRSASFAIGLAYDPVFCHPELFLLTVSKSTAADILEGAKSAPDRNEAAQLLAYPMIDVLDEDGPLATAPKTWSFIKARNFLAQHLLASDAI
ncbi:NUDIX hydrolase [Neorhizobium galegae]|uniref:NUDIX hydrolase n=1 Tax=Neorhizobium galegae TaxID=399 RepID=UPI002100C73F|nr:NUDIX hydrolase [Neorhizobium galegae]MCQ1574957.1 NUDIX hydrolase [Neorhizobium galegae]